MVAICFCNLLAGLEEILPRSISALTFREIKMDADAIIGE